MKNTKPIILDTTYVLPLFGIQIDLLNNSQEHMKKIWNNDVGGYQVYLPSICLIETMYKLLSEYRNTGEYEILNRYQTILPTILNLPLEIVNCEMDPKISKIASLIRHSGHPDFMDCWIAGTAATFNGVLLSEDLVLKKKLVEIPETKELVIWNWKDLIEIIEKH